jgi:trimeric autotransporter adhesin
MKSANIVSSLLFALVLCLPLTALAASKPDLEQRVIQLEALVATLQEELAARSSELAAQAAELAAQNSLLEGVYRLEDPYTGQDTLQFAGMNVQIVNGTGATSGTPDGTGNLIIGYNEIRGESNCPAGYFCNRRDGSHNLVIGIENNYSSFGGMVVGYANEIVGIFSSVSGGLGNTARGQYSSVSGGVENSASGALSSVSGGYGNDAFGQSSSVSGGRFNEATGDYASVSAGGGNEATGDYASVSGGLNNTASGIGASVSGRSNNNATTTTCWEGDSVEDC